MSKGMHRRRRRYERVMAASRRAAWCGWGPVIFNEVLHMADQLQQLRDQMDALLQSARDTATRVKDTEDQLQQVIDDLKAHPAAPDLTDILGKAQDIKDALSAINPLPTTPTPTPPGPQSGPQGGPQGGVQGTPTGPTGPTGPVGTDAGDNGQPPPA